MVYEKRISIYKAKVNDKRTYSILVIIACIVIILFTAELARWLNKRYSPANVKYKRHFFEYSSFSLEIWILLSRQFPMTEYFENNQV